jgi:hypothetical protein
LHHGGQRQKQQHHEMKEWPNRFGVHTSLLQHAAAQVTNILRFG